jgi:hypothetical protein
MYRNWIAPFSGENGVVESKAIKRTEQGMEEV